MKTTTQLTAGRGWGIDPNGWLDPGMNTTMQLPAGGTIDVSGWPPPARTAPVQGGTGVRTGQGHTIDPDGWPKPRSSKRDEHDHPHPRRAGLGDRPQRRSGDRRMTMTSITHVRAGQGSGIDPNGWREPSDGSIPMNTTTHLRAGEGSGICPNGNPGPGGGSGSGSSGSGWRHHT
jgi:hypothetical protein